MARVLTATLILSLSLLPGLAGADALTQMIQQDLTTLGFETGGTDGEMNVQTAVAISQCQAQNGLEVTGEASPQLAGVIKSKIGQQGQATPVAQAAQIQQSQRPAGGAMVPRTFTDDPTVAAQRAQANQAQQAQTAAVDQAMMARGLEAQQRRQAQIDQMRAAQAQQAEVDQAQAAQMAAAMQAAQM